MKSEENNDRTEVHNTHQGLCKKQQYPMRYMRDFVLIRKTAQTLGNEKLWQIERSRYALETNKSPLASDRGRQVGSTSEEPLSEEEAEKAEQKEIGEK